MKRLIAIILVLAYIVILAGCNTQTYKLPHDQFCYSAYTNEAIELTLTDKEYIIDLLNNADWMNDVGKCECDFVFYTQAQKLYYHSDCGSFNDYTNTKYTTVSEQDRITINAMLGID